MAVEHRNRKYLRQFKPMEQKLPFASHKVPNVNQSNEDPALDNYMNGKDSPDHQGGGGRVGREDEPGTFDPGLFVNPPNTSVVPPVVEPVPEPQAQPETRPPPPAPARSVPAPARRSDRAPRPNARYSAEEYDLSGVWYGGGGDS